ncbi:hypothetical protein LOTGIDRAFT_159865 [Lottia gigantea]|uniref:PAS domain-containing protein n=1 Tax=Lottia gigantea TaxID=225164 RepID=V4ANV0_LOTGI|nr:hypothetical protein LOTGIDRAFT_159865 [Lottia gigantea]ESO96455.1 hypothetical protein LOTGIDRAFT_159865 [Lottia gigantea]
MVWKDEVVYMCSGDEGREDEALISQESSDLEVESIKTIPESPASLFNNNLMLQAYGGFLLFLTKKGTIMFVSENVEEHLGYSQEDMISHSITEFISPAYYHEIHNHLKVRTHKSCHLHQDPSEILSTVHSRNFCIEMKTNTRKVEDKILRNNSLVMTKWSGKVKVRPSKKAKGYSTEGLMCICCPVQSSAILEVRMEGQMFMSRHNMDMTYIYCEKRIVTLIGYEPTDLIGKTCYQFHNPLDVKKISSCHSNLLAKGASTSKYYRFLGKSGDWVWMQTQATIIYDAENKGKYVVCMNYIISKEDGEKYLKYEEEQNGIPDPQIHGCIDLTSTPTKPVPITEADNKPQTDQTQSQTEIQPNSATTEIQSNSFHTENSDIQPNSVSSGVSQQANSSTNEPSSNSIINVVQPNAVTSKPQGSSVMTTEKTISDWSNVQSSSYPGCSPTVTMTSVTESMLNPGIDIMDENNSTLNMEEDDEDDLFDLDLEVPSSLLPIEKVKVTSVASLTQNSDPLLCPLSKESNILMTTESSPVESESSITIDIDNDFGILDDLLENINHFPSTSLSSPVGTSPGGSRPIEAGHFSKLPYTVDGIQGRNGQSMSSPNKIVTNANFSPKITDKTFNPKNPVQKSCQLLPVPFKNLQERPLPSKNSDSCQQNLSSGSLLRSLLHRESPPPLKTKTTSSPSPIASSIPLNQNAQCKSKSSFYTTSTSCVSSNQSLLSAVLEGNATLNIPTCKKTVPISMKNAHLTSRKVMNSQPRFVQRTDPYKKTFCSHGHSCQGLARPVYQTINVKTLSDFAFLKNLENGVNVNDSAKNERFLDNDSHEVELPDDLLDLHIQYCDGLAEDQTQALLAEFEQDLLSSPEDLLIPDSVEDPRSPNTESYQNYFTDVLNIDSYSKSYQLPSNQNQDINITSTNQQSLNNSNNHMTSCCKGNINTNKTTDNNPPSWNCCHASRQGGLQSPTVSSTQVGKICLSPASAHDDISSSSDSDFCEDQNKTKKTVTSSNSIGVQTAYTNSKNFNFPQYSKLNGGQSTKNRMSELEQHLRGYKSCNNSQTTECLECTNIERHSKVTPFLHKLLTGEISRDLYHEVDKLLLNSKNSN